MMRLFPIFAKKLFFLASVLFFAMNILFAQEEIIGKDAPENFSWTPPSDNEMSFRVISLDNVARKYYVRVGDFFAPVEIKVKNPGTIYPHKKAGAIVFYKRFPIESADAVKGTARFVPELSVETNNASDIFIGVYSAGGKANARSVDVSLENMPLGSFSIINFNPQNMYFAVDKKPVRLPFFQMSIHTFSAGKRQPIGVAFDIYSAPKNNAKPVRIEHKKCTFLGGERTLVLIFHQRKIKESVGSLTGDADYQTGYSYNETVDDMMFITNRGPRT